MANGYPTVQPDPLSQFKADLAKLENRVSTLEKPTGTQIADAVAQLRDQVANQVRGAVSSNSSNITWNAAFQGGGYLTFTTPAGFTRALVIAIGGAALTDTGVFYFQVVVAGSGGVVSNAVQPSGIAGYISGTQSVALSGLSAGQTFTVYSQARATGASGNSTPISTTAMVMFLV